MTSNPRSRRLRAIPAASFDGLASGASAYLPLPMTSATRPEEPPAERPARWQSSVSFSWGGLPCQKCNSGQRRASNPGRAYHTPPAIVVCPGGVYSRPARDESPLRKDRIYRLITEFQRPRACLISIYTNFQGLFFAAVPPDVRKWLCPSGSSGIFSGLRPDCLALKIDEASRSVAPGGRFLLNPGAMRSPEEKRRRSRKGRATSAHRAAQPRRTGRRKMYRRLSNLRRLVEEVLQLPSSGSMMKPPQVGQPTVHQRAAFSWF